ncbi:MULTISPECIES: hypothetical protein [Shewanella]|uniref:hypothetical protein n=1 Tax=Shewanella TaxID=22 RepID=UPI001EFCA3D7|nr:MULTISPECIES: hypothetical protein [Shewanella]MCG9745767.1 hypothetical protein [Shewanella sp. Isolate8]MCL1040777.1 hypothetical protein [Shewanella marisflavi]
MTLDKLSLDEMVQGVDSSDENWVKLLQHPDAERVWADAVKRRESLNAFCSLAARWPAIVHQYKKLKSFTKKSTTSPQISLFSDSYQPFSAALSSKSDEDQAFSLDVKWGEQQIVELDKDILIQFNGGRDINVYYSFTGGDGVIGMGDSWAFKLDEGAVLLTFVEGERLSNDFESMLSNAESVGSVVLLPSK